MRSISVTQVLSPFVDFSKVPSERLYYAMTRGTDLHMVFAAHAQDLFVPRFPADYQGYFDSFRRWFDRIIL